MCVLAILITESDLFVCEYIHTQTFKKILYIYIFYLVSLGTGRSTFQNNYHQIILDESGQTGYDLACARGEWGVGLVMA